MQPEEVLANAPQMTRFCPRCGSQWTRLATSWSISDLLANPLGKVALRCCDCQSRFYVDSNSLPANESENKRRKPSLKMAMRSERVQSVVRKAAILAAVVLVVITLVFALTHAD